MLASHFSHLLIVFPSNEPGSMIARAIAAQERRRTPRILRSRKDSILDHQTAQDRESLALSVSRELRAPSATLSKPLQQRDARECSYEVLF